MSYCTAYKDIRSLVEMDGRTIKDIAMAAGVPYDSLQRWMSGRQRTLTVDVAEKVFFTLTGKRFTR